MNLGLAVGGVPVVMQGAKVMAVGLHCKTVNAPADVTLGRSDNPDVLRPSPFQLRRNPDKSLKARADCIGDVVNTLVADDGVQSGPRKIGEYNPASAIPLVINIDQTGARTEEAVPYEVPSLKNAKSVFGDGAYITVDFKDGKATIEGKKIPEDLLKAWAASDDAAPPDHSLDFSIGNGKAVNFTTPAANLVLYLLKL